MARNDPKAGNIQKKSRGGMRATTGVRYNKSTAIARFLEHYEAGLDIGPALEKVGRTRKTYENWRRVEPGFADHVDLLRSTRKIDSSDRDSNRARAKAMGFAAWRAKYLKAETYWHQLQWIDLIEGREPRDLHIAETHTPGKKGRILINVPPNHGKTTTMTVDYSVYRICCDPNVKIAVISETADMARKFLAEIKDKLSQPDYAELIRDFAPEGGYRQSSDIWGATQIKLAAADRTKAQKDPTVEALGIGSQIYGARLDLIFMDDCVGVGNASQWKNQLEWFRRMVVNRPGPGGRIIVVGTRVTPYDLYGQLLDSDNYGGKTSPWSCLAQPAVLEEPSPDKPEGKTLWPYSAHPWVENELDDCEFCDGYCVNPIEVDGEMLYPRWDYTHLMNGPRSDTGDERSWQIIYQQRAIPDDSVFPEHAVRAAVNNRRRWGLEGGLDTIPEGCYLIGSLDPAVSGSAFALVYAVDRNTRKRYVVDALNMKGPTPQHLKNVIKRWTIEYPIREWRIEDTGLLQMFVQDYELNSWLNARNVPLKRHNTNSKSKWDVSFGVASMSTLFGTYEQSDDGWKEVGERYIDFPRLDTPSLNLLFQQLVTWSPELDPKKIACDGVMALWFAEIGARDLLKVGKRHNQNFMTSKFHSKSQLGKQQVVDLSGYRNRQVA